MNSFRLFHQIEQVIDPKQSIEDQLDALAQFDNLSHEEMVEIAQTCHHSTSAVLVLEYLGIEKIRPYWGMFMVFLQDANWGTAGVMGQLLLKAGKDIIPELRRVFYEVKNDDTWHYWILLNIVQFLDKELMAEMKGDLLELVARADYEGAATEALVILKENQLITAQEVEDQYQYLLSKFEGNDYMVNDLKEEMGITE